MVITNSVFTENAYKLARSNRIELWDRAKIIEVMRSSKEKRALTPALKAAHDKRITPADQGKQLCSSSFVCPKCGASLVARNGKFGRFLGCSNYPKCRYTVNVNSQA